MEYFLHEILTEYSKKNVDGIYEPVAVGKYGIRKRSEIYKKDLSEDYTKNKLIYLDTLTIGMGSKQIDFGVLKTDDCYSVSPAYKTFKINSKIVDSHYFELWLLSRNSYLTQKYMIASARQGKKVDIENLLLEKIDIPSDYIQKKVVANYTYIRNLIDKENVLITLFDELESTKFIEMFGDPITNAMGWEKVSIGDCLLSIDSGKSFVCSNESRKDLEPAILKLSAASNGFYHPCENKAIIDKEDFVEKSEVHNGDLLFTRKNTPELVGTAAYVYSTPSGLMMPDLIFRLNTNEKCNKIFLCSLINHDMFRPMVQSIASGSAKSMSNISQGRLCGLLIGLPPISLQEKFAIYVKNIYELRMSVLDRIKLLEELLDKYLYENFNV